MADAERSGRANQKRRTRKALLQAAARLMQQGRKPSFDEVADEALVSRATAYRYFSGIDELLVEASLDVALPDVAEVLGDAPPDDPVARMARVGATFHELIVANEVPFRLMLAQTLQRSVSPDAGADLPRRQNRRSALIEAALTPMSARLPAEVLDRLAKALAIVVGIEAAIVCKDVLQLDDGEAQDVQQWAIRALINAALADAPEG